MVPDRINGVEVISRVFKRYNLALGEPASGVAAARKFWQNNALGASKGRSAKASIAA
jgi:hypothetical protein